MNETQTIQAMQETIHILTEAISHIRHIVSKTHSDHTAIAVQEISFRAIKEALTRMEAIKEPKW
jgi:hypothetical protein